jgi:hypothetical protein
METSEPSGSEYAREGSLREAVEESRLALVREGMTFWKERGRRRAERRKQEKRERKKLP